jgi:diguanylate cyclase (GGDEF)-like protein
MIDVDFFKRFNDYYGHQTGDDCLQQIANTLKESLRRPADLVARYGGEEFACILPDTGFAEALAIASELEQSVRRKAIAHADSSAASVVTISVGVGVAWQDGTKPTRAGDLLNLADAQLYNAKKAGRARVCGDQLPGN